MTIRETIKALEKIEKNMSSPNIPIFKIFGGYVEFVNDCIYSMKTGEKVE